MTGNHPIIKYLFLVSIFLLIVSRYHLSAQFTSQPDIIQTPLSDRLPVDNQNWEICRNPVNGFMYFANSKGLIEYNGIVSRLFTMPFDQGIRSVYADSQGNIYTGSFEDFGSWRNDAQGGLIYQSLAGGVTIPKNDEIWNILELNGTIYFQSFTTIYALKNAQVKAINAPGIMLFLFKTGRQFIVQVLGQGLFNFNGVQFDFVEGSKIFSSREVLAVIQRPKEELWICTANDGIYSFKNNTFTALNNEISAFLKQQTCNAGLALNDSMMVFGTILSGIAFCNGNGKVLNAYNYANGLNNNTVLSLYSDADNGLWIGLDEGANYVRLYSPYKLFADKNGSLGTIYTAVRRNNQLYLGTNHGLFIADILRTDGEYDFPNLQIIPGTQGQVWKLYEFGGQLLCGHNDGTYIVNDKTVSRISDVTGGWSFAGYNEFLLQGTYTGIICYQKDKAGNWSYRNRMAGFGEPARYIEVDYLGYVWVVHPQKGIFRLELNENTDSVTNILQFSSIAQPSGKMNISSVNNQVVFMTSMNIYSFDATSHSFTPIRSLEAGLGEYSKATQIIHHEKNSYWFMLDNKIVLFDISKSFEATKLHELIQKYIDLPGREQQIIALDRKTLLIPTRQAFTLFDLGWFSAMGNIEPPQITHMIFTGKARKKTLVPGTTKKMTVSSKENNLTAFIADPSSYGRGDKGVQYRIPELDDTWHQTILNNIVFLHMQFGTYHLQVRSLASPGVSEVVFKINRPWYLTNAAIIGYVLGLAGLVLLGMKIFRIELNRHRQLIEYEVRKNKLESELDYKSYELMLTMRYLIRKTEILKELQMQIDSLKAESSKFPVKFVREMERIIRDGLDSQTEEWKSAMSNLKLSQEGFFRRLKDKFPNLTPNDLRLCSYLRMNFSTKEIAHLLNISGRAVEIGRYRLRVKMHLDHKINLTEFLISEAERDHPVSNP
jgi:ligand-binding sensor domain-containing protein/DNA-binding CsgD family transcriptional regulator